MDKKQLLQNELTRYSAKRDGWKLSRVEMLERDRSELAELLVEADLHDDNDMVRSLSLSLANISGEIERLSK